MSHSPSSIVYRARELLGQGLAVAMFCAALFMAPDVRAETESMRRSLQKIGDCAIRGQEERALALFLKPTSADKYKRDNAILIERLPSCVAGQGAGRLQVSPWDFDAMVADSLVRKFYVTKDPGDLAEVNGGILVEDLTMPPISTNVKDKDFGRTFKSRLSDLQGYFFNIFAECVTRRDSASVRLLVLSDVDSAEEARGFQSLKGAFEYCLPAESPFQLAKFPTRGWLAINYLSLAEIKAKG